MTNHICFLKTSQDGLGYESTPIDTTGKILPKDRNTYRIVILSDNPDIASLTTEKRLTEQACFELEKQIGYNIKIYHEKEIHPIPDITIEFRDSDPYFTSNVLAYAWIPQKGMSGFKGQVVFNNKFVWLDGSLKTGAELRKLGIVLPGMIDSQYYQSYNYKQTIKHELCGHTFGLLHNEIEDKSVMQPIYADYRTMYGNRDKEILNTKYGKASFVKRALPDTYIEGLMKRPI